MVKKTLAEVIIAVFVVVGLAAWLLPSAEPTPAVPTYAMQTDWASSAWAFSKFMLFLAPGIFVLSVPLLVLFWLCSRHIVEYIKAQHPMPELTHLTYSPRVPAYHAAPALAEPIDVAPALPNTIDMTDVLGRWQPSPSAILLGLGPGGQPLTTHVKGLCHVALAGPTGNGKSNLLRLLLSQLLATDAQVVLCDPHYADLDPESGDDWRPIRSRLAMDVATTPGDIKHTLGWFMHELDHRLALRRAGEHPGAPTFLALDELPSITAAIKDAPATLERLLREGRKVNLLVISAAHDMLVRTFRSDSGAVRECFKTSYYMGGDQQTGRILLDMQGRIDDGSLGAGVAYLRSPATPVAQRVRVPLASNDAVYELVGMPAKSERNHFELVPESVSMASESPKTLDPTAARIISLFRQGCEIAEIVRTIDPEAKTGARYQKVSKDVQVVLRKFLQEHAQ